MKTVVTSLRRIRFLSFRWTSKLVLLLMLLIPVVVFADNTVIDGDGLMPFTSNSTLNLGSICLGQSKSGNVLLAISRQGSASGTNTFANNEQVILSADTPSNANVSAVFTNNDVVLPGNWTGAGNGTISTDVGVSAVTVTAAGTPGNKSATIVYTASGTNSSGSEIDRSATLNINWTVITCVPTDATAPVANPSQSLLANGNGWNNSDVTVSWNWTDESGGSGIDTTNCTTSSTSVGEGNIVLTATCQDLAGNQGTASYTVNVDKTAPTATATADLAPNGNGWNNSDVTVTFTGSDALSGMASCDAPTVLSSEGAGQFASGSCTDLAGNSTSATASGINIDKTAPIVGFIGGIDDGSSFYFGSVPAAPTCSASDALSGLDGTCIVNGYGATVGTHTLDASAMDLAGNAANSSVSYTVLAWTITGFYNPVDMSSSVWNTVKGGATVPLKFELFAGATELTNTAFVNMSAKQVSCNGGMEDAVDEDMLNSGSTNLRYEQTEGQFIQNWKTPKQLGKCYEIKMTAVDGSTIVANFKLK